MIRLLNRRKHYVMKKLFIGVFLLTMALGAGAQHVIHGGGGVVYGRPRVVVGLGAYVPFYSYPYFGFYPYYYPYGPGYGYRPSRLTLQIEDIRRDYQDKIRSARHDKTLSRDEKKATVQALKEERDKKIGDLRNNYYKH